MGVSDVQFLQLGQAGQVRQTGIADLSAAKVRKLEVDQPVEFRQAGVRDGRVVEIEPLQAVKRKRSQAAIRDSRRPQIELRELGNRPSAARPSLPPPSCSGRDPPGLSVASGLHRRW